MKMYIPELGDSFRLAADWEFKLYNEERNSTLMKRMGDTRQCGYHWRRDIAGIPCVIPAGSTLKIDRIYIRKGQDEFNSITFLWVGEHIPSYEEEVFYPANPPYSPAPRMQIMKHPRKPIRFWAKMADVNKIEFESV